MLPKNSSSALFDPGMPPQDAAQLQRYLINFNAQVQAALGALASGHLPKTTVAPKKPRDGDWAYADGVTWNPGGGKGLYFFTTVWTLVQALP
jgi:hypothetical protein